MKQVSKFGELIWILTNLLDLKFTQIYIKYLPLKQEWMIIELKQEKGGCFVSRSFYREPLPRCAL